MWLPEDTQAALEWIEHRSMLCSGCGHSKTESVNPDNAANYTAVPVTCFGCKPRDAEVRRASTARAGGKFSDDAFDGLYIAVVQGGEG